MSSLNELKRHLSAVEDTRQITNAMYLLSTARMKKCLQNIEYNLRHFKELHESVKHILASDAGRCSDDPYLSMQNAGASLFIAVTSDKGLCANYNSQVVELTVNKMREHADNRLCVLGLAGNSLFIGKGCRPHFVKYGASQHPTIMLARELAEMVIELYAQHEIKEIFVVYTKYVNSVVQIPVCERVLPLLAEDFSDITEDYNYAECVEYSPSVNRVIDHIVPQYLIGYLFDIMNQAACSENVMRMNAMQNATHNADEMIESLRRQINAERQLAITNEITEIASAMNIPGAV